LNETLNNIPMNLLPWFTESYLLM